LQVREVAVSDPVGVSADKFGWIVAARWEVGGVGAESDLRDRHQPIELPGALDDRG
jgi:hypothetical protein